jgi:hypothetical protein
MNNGFSLWSSVNPSVALCVTKNQELTQSNTENHGVTQR